MLCFLRYHRRYRRVPSIDQCYMHDMVCREEANVQFKRDMLVEENVLRTTGHDRRTTTDEVKALIRRSGFVPARRVLGEVAAIAAG